MRASRICSRCVLPDNFPGIRFDSNGVCSICNDAPPLDEIGRIRDGLRQQMERVLDEARSAEGDYHCIVAYSGGKDSTYTLWLFTQKYKLRCLAVTVDNGFLSPTAVENCRTVSEQLGIDHIFYKPSFRFLSTMYRKSIEQDVHVRASIARASAICNSCINVVNTYVIKLALATRVPVIAGGYVGGQVPKGSAVMSLDLASLARARAKTISGYLQVFGTDAARYVCLPEDLRQAHPIVVINPLLTLEYRVEEALDVIRALGWKMPADTGRNSSNCQLNDFGIFDHYRKYGFNPYIGELAEQVRFGLMDRRAAMDKAMAIPTEAAVRPIMDRLEMSGMPDRPSPERPT